MNWLRRLFAPRCQHDWRGVANYYDEGVKSYVHLTQCRVCGETAITGES